VILENVFNTENNNIANILIPLQIHFWQIYYAWFLKKKIYVQSSPKQGLTIGINTSSKRKNVLYLLTMILDNNHLKQYYKSYSNFLTKVINEEKDSTIMIKLPTPIIL
jgi:hypothetical protein